MDINQFKVIITPTASKEIERIYDYIVEDLHAETSAKELMRLVEEKVQNLKYAPRIHAEIEKCDELRRKYRRITIKNYIILYTIDEDNAVVYVTHMYYGLRNYLNDYYI